MVYKEPTTNYHRNLTGIVPIIFNNFPCKFVTIIFFLILLLPACDIFQPEEDNPSGIHIAIESDSNFCTSSQPITITVTVTNHTDTTYISKREYYRFIPNSVVESDYGFIQTVSERSFLLPYLPGYYPELAPGESISDSWQWFGELNYDHLFKPDSMITKFYNIHGEFESLIGEEYITIEVVE